MYREGALNYDDNSMRWSIKEVDLHCGDVIEVYHDGYWEPVRIEFDHSIKEYCTIPDIPLKKGMQAIYSTD